MDYAKERRTDVFPCSKYTNVRTKCHPCVKVEVLINNVGISSSSSKATENTSLSLILLSLESLVDIPNGRQHKKYARENRYGFGSNVHF